MTSAEWISGHLLRRTPRQALLALLKWSTAPIVFVLLFVLPALESHWTLFKKVGRASGPAPLAWAKVGLGRAGLGSAD